MAEKIVALTLLFLAAGVSSLAKNPASSQPSTRIATVQAQPKAHL